jgi:hypothetical protein
MRVKTAISLILISMACCLPGWAESSTGKQEIQISCYIGDPRNNQYIGTVSVFSTLQAASACNMVYNDCDMNCTGCWTDEDAREICVDKSGQPYYN